MKMSKMDDLMQMARISELMSKLKRKDSPIVIKEEKEKNIFLRVVVVIGIIAAVAAVSYAVYKFVCSRCFDEYEDEYGYDDDDDFFDDEDFDDEDIEDETELEDELTEE